MNEKALFQSCQKMYTEIKEQIADLSPVNSTEIDWYKFVSNVIGLSDREANNILWEQTTDNLEEIDWGRTYDELDMLHGDLPSLNATIDDELNKVY
ncbi:hypothetical protein [Mammaliicoccus lentus]|uniref:hypothetical protein n=1 Tax=Mammaliicoccus lentus TaxID=42858 RepID=UPI0010715F47|nr:hypothetical protein [Mammaliicoccus lentus]MBF0795196.1 hypothetical protein [Mammaliicoccus lentus]TFV14597.1 hypothetical protein E4T78_11065 [Mammaliicoccus lentus]